MRAGSTTSDPSSKDGVSLGMRSATSRGNVFGVLRLVCGLVLFALVVAAVWRSWRDVRSAIGLIDAHELALAELVILAGLAFSVLTWRRSVAEIGVTVPVGSAARIYLVGQLGKYLPGSVWALAAQSELGRSVGVPRSRGLAASVIAIGVNVVTGLAIGVALVPSLAGGGLGPTVGLVVVAAVCASALSPPVLTRLVDLGLRIIRRPALDRRITWKGVIVASAWSVASWLCYGASVWMLAVAVGAPAAETLPLCLAGVALAMTVGFLVVVTPSGIGVREAVLVGALAPVLNRTDALAVALVARLLFTVADVLAAAVVLPIRTGRSNRAAT